jgi:hypothetical protein
MKRNFKINRGLFVSIESDDTNFQFYGDEFFIPVERVWNSVKRFKGVQLPFGKWTPDSVKEFIESSDTVIIEKECKWDETVSYDFFNPNFEVEKYPEGYFFDANHNFITFNGELKCTVESDYWGSERQFDNRILLELLPNATIDEKEIDNPYSRELSIVIPNIKERFVVRLEGGYGWYTAGIYRV